MKAKYDEIELKLTQEKSEIEKNLKDVKKDKLKDHFKKILRLSYIYFELDLKSEYNTLVERYVLPIGIDQFMDSSEITFFVGLQKFNDHQFDESLKLIQRSLEINPKNYKALNTLACITIEINPKNKQEYINLLKRVLEIKEDYYRSHLNIAIAYEEEGDFENSNYHYNRSIELKPNLFKLYQNYAYFLLSFEKYEDCIQILKTSNTQFKDAQNQYDIQQLFSECHFEMYNFDLSLEYAEKCIKLDTEKFSGYFSKGNALFSLGNYNEAITFLQLCIEKKLNNNNKSKDTNCGIEYYNLGLSYMQLNQFDNAIIHFKNSLQENTNYNNAYRQIMRIYSQQQKYVEYLDTYEQSVLNTSKQNKSLIIHFLLDYGYQIPITRIKAFMENILLSNMSNIKIINRIYQFMKVEKLKGDPQTTKRQIYHQICYIIAEMYLRFQQSLQLILVYNKTIKEIIKFQQKYSIWDLLID